MHSLSVILEVDFATLRLYRFQMILYNVCRLLETRKKKNKKSREEEDEFPGREEIKFGDVVVAPPKLITVPKVQLKYSV